MLQVELPGGFLYEHERIVLEHSDGEFLLPVTVVRDDGGIRLLYVTEGYLTVPEYGFHGDLYRMFGVLRSYVRKIYEAQDMLLRPALLFTAPERIFVSADDCAVRLVYGDRGDAAAAAQAEAAQAAEAAPAAPTAQAAPNPADRKETMYGAYTEALMPLLSALAGKKSVTGARTAMTQLAKKIRTSNPDYGTALRIIESVERQWNYMQPAGI